MLKYRGHEVRLLTGIGQPEYEKIYELEKFCKEQDGVNLKVELEYKLHLAKIADEKADKKKSDIQETVMKEFLYYVGEELVSYLGISCFDGVTGEINGMTHPEWRQRGMFHRLLELAEEESKRAGWEKLLLVSDGKSETGMSVLKTAGTAFDHAEYRMIRKNGEVELAEHNQAISLRLATKADEIEIAKQNHIYFEDELVDDETGQMIVTPIEECPENTEIYMIELEGNVIGKINVEYSEQSAFVLGFGIRPEYRRNGYGRDALTEIISMIEKKSIPQAELDVVCTNSNALNLYQSCGFVEESVMNYYRV